MDDRGWGEIFVQKTRMHERKLRKILNDANDGTNPRLKCLKISISYIFLKNIQKHTF